VKIISIAVSRKKGTRKIRVDRARVILNHGLEGDAHAGPWHRQVSFLASESIQEAREKGLEVDFGDFAENVATEGLDWKDLAVGTQVKLGKTVIVEVSQIGKTCHKPCAIYYQAGDCIMPREGVFARVIQGGEIVCGDSIQVMATSPDPAGHPHPHST
jgi:MOSC domain-containing protein YiiM